VAYLTPDRVRETSTTTGTGAITLAGAVTGWKTFASGLSTNDTFPYVIEGRDSSGNQTAEWETGIGTWSAGGTLTRTTVTGSSNSGNAVSFASASLVCYVGLNKTGLVSVADISAASAVYAHTQVADPHTGYVLESREGVASGIATLDSDTLVPAAQLGLPTYVPIYATAAGRYGIPGAGLVQLIQAGGTVTVSPDNRMMVTPFVAGGNVTITGASFQPSAPSAAGGLAQVCLYSATINSSGLFIIGSLIENFGTLALDSYGQKTITGLTRNLTRGTAYALTLACSKAVTLYAPRLGMMFDQTWAGTTLGNFGSYFYIDTAYPPPATVNAAATEASGTTQFLAPVVTVTWTPR
jgi:hypothetical protein